jgi:hypothetical protein
MMLSAVVLAVTFAGRKRLLAQEARQARRRSEWAATMQEELRRRRESER